MHSLPDSQAEAVMNNPATPHYGNRKVSKMYNQIRVLRAAVRAHDPIATEAAWDDVEEHIDFVYGRCADEQT
jgi:hypothetical protein